MLPKLVAGRRRTGDRQAEVERCLRQLKAVNQRKTAAEVSNATLVFSESSSGSLVKALNAKEVEEIKKKQNLRRHEAVKSSADVSYNPASTASTPPSVSKAVNAEHSEGTSESLQITKILQENAVHSLDPSSQRTSAATSALASKQLDSNEASANETSEKSQERSTEENDSPVTDDQTAVLIRNETYVKETVDVQKAVQPLSPEKSPGQQEAVNEASVNETSEKSQEQSTEENDSPVTDDQTAVLIRNETYVKETVDVQKAVQPLSPELPGQQEAVDSGGQLAGTNVVEKPVEGTVRVENRRRVETQRVRKYPVMSTPIVARPPMLLDTTMSSIHSVRAAPVTTGQLVPARVLPSMKVDANVEKQQPANQAIDGVQETPSHSLSSQPASPDAELGASPAVSREVESKKRRSVLSKEKSAYILAKSQQAETQRAGRKRPSSAGMQSAGPKEGVDLNGTTLKSSHQKSPLPKRWQTSFVPAEPEAISSSVQSSSPSEKGQSPVDSKVGASRIPTAEKSGHSPSAKPRKSALNVQPEVAKEDTPKKASKRGRKDTPKPPVATTRKRVQVNADPSAKVGTKVEKQQRKSASRPIESVNEILSHSLSSQSTTPSPVAGSYISPRGTEKTAPKKGRGALSNNAPPKRAIENDTALTAGRQDVVNKVEPEIAARSAQRSARKGVRTKRIEHGLTVQSSPLAGKRPYESKKKQRAVGKAKGLLKKPRQSSVEVETTPARKVSFHRVEVAEYETTGDQSASPAVAGPNSWSFSPSVRLLSLNDETVVSSMTSSSLSDDNEWTPSTVNPWTSSHNDTAVSDNHDTEKTESPSGGSSGYISRLNTPEISWAKDRQYEKGVRRSMRNRVRPLCPWIGEKVEYKWVNGLPEVDRAVAGELSLYLKFRQNESPKALRKRREEQKKLNQRLLKRQNLSVMLDESAVGNLDSNAFVEVDTENPKVHITRRKDVKCLKIFDKVSKFDYGDFRIIELEKKATFNGVTTYDENWHIIKGAIIISIDEQDMALYSNDAIRLDSGVQYRIVNAARTTTKIHICEP